MKPLRVLAVLAASALPAFAQSLPISLDAAISGNAIDAQLRGPSPDFLGAVVLSLSNNQTHFLQGLPPVLTDFVILGVGKAWQAKLALHVPQDISLPANVPLFAQGLLVDRGLVLSSAVVTVLRG